MFILFFSTICFLTYRTNPDIGLISFFLLAMFVFGAKKKIAEFSKDNQLNQQNLLDIINNCEDETPLPIKQMQNLIKQSFKKDCTFGYAVLAPFYNSHHFETLGRTLNNIAKTEELSAFNLFVIKDTITAEAEALQDIPYLITDGITIIKTKLDFEEFKAKYQ